MISSDNAKFKDWFENYTWEPEKCSLDNKEYGEFLSSYLRNHDSELVLNLNGSWGTGKTHFLKQLYTNLLGEHKYPTVYINAWRSDFTNDPLLVIISELTEQLQSIHNGHCSITTGLHENLGRYAKKAWNLGVTVAASTIVAQARTDGTSTQALADHFKFSGVSEPAIGKNLTDGYKEQLKAIDDTHKTLIAYIDSLQEHNKVFILVDELDRCRPNYAVEMLETIKHFFNIPNIIFVVATDTEQLSHSVKAVYGNGFNGKEYLTRFFNRTATLPTPNINQFIQNVLTQYTVGQQSLEEKIKESNLFPNIKAHNVISLVQYIEMTCKVYEFSLRRVDQLIAKFHSIIVSELDKNPHVVFDFNMLIILLVENSCVGYEDVYKRRKKNSYFSGFEVEANTIDIHVQMRLLEVQKQKVDVCDSQMQSDLYSWRFMHGFLSSFEGNSHSIGNSIIEIRQNLQHRRESIHKNEYPIAQRYFEKLKLLDKEEQSCIIWNKSDYFKAVELAKTLS